MVSRDMEVRRYEYTGSNGGVVFNTIAEAVQWLDGYTRGAAKERATRPIC